MFIGCLWLLQQLIRVEYSVDQPVGLGLLNVCSNRNVLDYKDDE